MKETESKFRVHPPFELPELTGSGSPVATVTDVEHQTLEARYVDTADLRLARQGVTLRYRAGEEHDGWDLKVPLGPRDDGVRDEVHVAGSPEDPPAELLRIVSAYLRGDAVQHVAALVTSRSLRRLLDADGALLAELVDDMVEVVDGDVVTARFREIEVEDKGGGRSVLTAMGKKLRAAGAVQGRFEPKLVRALGPLATAPADPPPAPRIRGRATVRDLVMAYLREQVRALLDADVALRLGGPEAVHDARVAARRLRSTLRTFESVLVAEAVTALGEELAWFAGELGGARDSEVMFARLRAAAGSLTPEDRPAATEMLDRWAAETEPAVGGAAVLDTDRYAALVRQLALVATVPPFTGGASALATKALPGLLRPAVRTFRSRMTKAVEERTVAEGYHRARIAVKRLRYAVEVTAPVYGGAARRYLQTVSKLQEELGDYHDTTVALAALSARREAPGVSAADAFIVGALHAGQVQALRDQERTMGTKWSKQSDRLQLSGLTDG
ncbi:MAG: hypothetical protein JWM93_2710 [Frankiales bacterium]|nr:hypothetical protein [Frankiales bacterium]